jgi:hypothetical protein
MDKGRRGESIFVGKEKCLCFIELLKETVEMSNFRVVGDLSPKDFKRGQPGGDRQGVQDEPMQFG